MRSSRRSLYWFPKVFGFKLDERSGKLFFWTFSLGTTLIFVADVRPGLQGETRRLDYLFDPQWKPLLIVEEIGIFLYCALVLLFCEDALREHSRPRAEQGWRRCLAHLAYLGMADPFAGAILQLCGHAAGQCPGRACLAP